MMEVRRCGGGFRKPCERNTVASVIWASKPGTVWRISDVSGEERQTQ